MSELNPYESPEAHFATEEEQEEYQPRVFSARGRIGRIRYLAYFFIYYWTFGGAIVLYALMSQAALERELLSSFSVFTVLGAVGYLIFFVGILVLAKRRINYLNASGWLLFIYLVPIINVVFGLVLLLAPGTKGINDYGPQPCKTPLAIWIVALSVPALILLIGVLAAIGFSAYEGYMERAGAEQAQTLPPPEIHHPIKAYV